MKDNKFEIGDTVVCTQELHFAKTGGVHRIGDRFTISAENAGHFNNWRTNYSLLLTRADDFHGKGINPPTDPPNNLHATCSACLNWEPRHNSGMGDGYCSIFDKFTDPDHGKLCTAFQQN